MRILIFGNRTLRYDAEVVFLVSTRCSAVRRKPAAKTPTCLFVCRMKLLDVKGPLSSSQTYLLLLWELNGAVRVAECVCLQNSTVRWGF